MEDHYQSLSHTKWQCKYHIIFIPKCRRKRLFGVVRKELGEVFHRLAEHKSCEILEGHILPDHAIHVARHVLKRGRNYAGQKLWARGYFVDSVGRNTEAIRIYIKNQEAEDQRMDELDFGSDDTKPNNNLNRTEH